MDSILPTKTICDFLTQAEIDYLVDLIMCDPTIDEYTPYIEETPASQKKEVRVTKRYYPKPKNLKIITDYLIKKLEPHGIFSSIKSLWILEVFKPHTFHNDVNDGLDSNFHVVPDIGQTKYYTLLIPITDAKAKTIVCQQNAEYESVDNYMKLNPPIEESRRLPLDFWQQQLSHCPIEHRQFLSHEFTFDWSLGALAAWDRRRFHASNDFLNNGATGKKALVAFTNVLKKNLIV
jgi:hypothetical protein